MEEYITRAKHLAINARYCGMEVSDEEIGRRVSNGLPSAYAPRKRNFNSRTYFSWGDPEGGLVRVEDLSRRLDGADDSHALAAGFKTRWGGQGGVV